MQIIDSSPFGVRSNVMRLRARESGPDVLLFPMIHLGQASYYEDVTERLGACDIILYESIDSRTVRHLTRSYRWVASNKRLGLVLQNSMKVGHLKDRLIHADVEGTAFERRWGQIARWIRVLVFFLVPYVALHRRWFATRAKLAKHMGVSVYEPSNGRPASEDLAKFTEVIVDWRDRHLISVLEQHRQKYATPETCIGVVYGAAHMSAVIRHLVRTCGYRVEDTEWITVFENY